jgi:hypothetical protein
MGLSTDASIVAVRLLLSLTQPMRWQGRSARSAAASASPLSERRRGCRTLFRVAHTGVLAAKEAGGGGYRNGTVGADGRIRK